ncbi:MAG: 4-hydroxy-3-methylbut-2-enyl diphosphate reductase [Anaeroplasmataceae bacterium]
MIINKLNPQGYCKGVLNAINLLNKTIEENQNSKPINLLGKIINNKNVVEYYKNKNCIIVDSENKSRLELLNDIKDGIIIFSAHGVSDKVRELALKKKLEIIDATCPYVKLIHNLIKNKINDEFTILYIGSKGHPETEGVLDISEDIILIENKNDLLKLNKSKKYFCTNQTTLSFYDLKNIYDSISQLELDCEISNKICNATTLRQKAVIEQPKADLCIIVGDVYSSNSKKLLEISTTIAKIPSIMVETLDDVKQINFENVNTINITSGASTPFEITESIYNYLCKIKKDRV